VKNKIDIFYDNLIQLCKKKRAKKVLYLISFFESIIFPLPTDPFLIPFIIAEKKIINIVALVTFFSVFGGVISFFIGSIIWNNLQPFFAIHYPGVELLINEFETNYNEFGVLLILIGGFSPFPYKITCLASGILGINILIFIFLSTLSRGIRFLLVSILIYKYGESSIKLIRKNVWIVSLILVLITFIFYLLYTKH
tara:strand:- start:661 stop:1248 length:588 start_codon:yes stop_codon:yes gene_type:complete